MPVLLIVDKYFQGIRTELRLTLNCVAMVKISWRSKLARLFEVIGNDMLSSISVRSIHFEYDNF